MMTYQEAKVLNLVLKIFLYAIVNFINMYKFVGAYGFLPFFLKSVMSYTWGHNNLKYTTAYNFI